MLRNPFPHKHATLTFACVMVIGSMLLTACGDDDSADATVDLSVTRDRGTEDQGGTADARADGTLADANVAPSQACADTGAAIRSARPDSITVSPGANGQVMVNGESRTLRQVVSNAEPNSTILLEDGTYTFPPGGNGSFTGIYFTNPSITLRSASGNASAVVLDSAYGDHGNSSAPITVAASGIVLADFTVQRSVFHLIHLWADGDDALMHNVRLVDGGQQFLKASPGGENTVDNAEVSCSEFLMTDAGRDNVWGYGPQDGSTACYTGGIDSHDARDWHIHDSTFEGIYCNAGGVQRPAHGMNPEERNGQTYTGGLTEHAIHMWDSEEGSGHTIERNTIINCGRGIGLGFRAEVYGTVIRNNMIFSELSGSGHDVGIELQRAHNSQVLNNTVFYSADDAYANSIEYRYESTSDVEIKNNLVNGMIRARNGANADAAANVTNAEASWFVDAAAGNLRLANCDNTNIVGAGEDTNVDVDVDGEQRSDRMDIGADHCSQ